LVPVFFATMDASEFSWSEIFGSLADRRELTEPQVRAVFEEMMLGRCGEAEVERFLLGLRNKGETPAEVAVAAQVLRRHMLRWDAGCEVLDTCGTGGDCTGTFNISTAAAFVAAGAGVKIVKHGNRSVSSKSGSADVLAALGVAFEGGPELARRQLEQAGLAFCFAPRFHPALRHVAAVRRRLGVPTIFNCLGPLANPAGAGRQLLGVGRPELLGLMSEALCRLGTRRAYLVCSREGLDEVSLSAPTQVREVRGVEIVHQEWTAATFGLDPVNLSELAAADAVASAAMIESVLAGQESAATRVVLANAAAALMVADAATSPIEGVALARHAVTSGQARQVLEQLRTLQPV
jgi:anthranilate phosphoribosyltransferase